MSKTHDYAGPIDALANYWLKKIAFSNAGETRAVPEYNLETCGAGAALDECLAERNLTTHSAFELGLQVARILARSPFEAELEIRAAIARAIEMSDGGKAHEVKT